MKHHGGGTFQLNLADGRWLQIRESVTSDGGIVSIQADITERKRAEAELAEKTAILESTLSAMDQGIAMYDGEHKLLAWNRAFSELRDFPESELYRGKPISEVARYQAERGSYDGALEHIEKEVDKQVQFWLDMARTMTGQRSGIQHRPDGTIHEVQAMPTNQPLPDRGSEQTGVTGQARARAARWPAAKSAAPCCQRSKSASERRSKFESLPGLKPILDNRARACRRRPEMFSRTVAK